MTEEHKEHWFKAISIIIATFLGAFLAFYFIAHLTMDRITSPEYQIKRMEKAMDKDFKSFRKLDSNLGTNPFEPRMAPMLVNLVKEPNEYKIVVDLKHLDNDEKNIDVELENNVVTISGEVEKKERLNENIMKFSQSYSLDEKLLSDKIMKERKGDKYIITIPFEQRNVK